MPDFIFGDQIEKAALKLLKDPLLHVGIDPFILKFYLF
jgi:hypothetical protein